MYVTSNRLLISAAVCGALLLAGCANHLPQRSEHEERIERRLLDHELLIDAGQPETLEVPQRRVRIHDQKSYELTTFEVTRRYDRYTPYQAWREIYEVPVGAVALVAGVTANVVNVLTFGSLPDSITHGWLRYGIDGLNPFMNVESNGRAEQNLFSIDEVQRSQRVDYVSLPWAERPVSVTTGGGVYSMLTDRHGVLHLNLLDTPFSDLDSSRLGALHLQVEDQTGDRSIKADATVLVSPALRGKLAQAHSLVFDDLEDGDVTQWIQRVQRLADLGLEEEASELEQSLLELSRHDPELQHEFLQALRRDAGRLVDAP